MLKQLSILDKLIILVFCLLLIIDTATGFLKFSGVVMPITLSQLMKIPLLIIMLFRVFILNKKHFTHILVLLFFLLISWVLNYASIGSFNITKEFSILLKIIIIPITLYYFVGLSNLDFDFYFKKIRIVYSIAFIVVLINICIGLAGFGFNSYVEGIGSKGFFFAGNELAILYVVLFSFLLNYVFNTYSRLKYIIFSVLGLFFGLFIATKVSMLSILILIFLIPIFSLNWHFNTKRVIISSISVAVFFSLSVFLYNYLMISGLLVKWTYFLKVYDYNYVSIILSGRDRFLEQAIIMSQENTAWFHQLFGYSFTGYIDLVSQTTTLHAQSIEMDFFDIYFYYGIIGLLLTLSFWFVVFYNYFKNKPNNNVILFTCVLILIISFLSGHVLFSGMSGPYIGIFLSLMFQNKIFTSKLETI